MILVAAAILAPAGVCAEVRSPGADAVVATSCSSADVQAAIDAAADGGSVRVPEGTCIWNSTVRVHDKTVTLRGAGAEADGTKIVYGGSNHTLLAIDAGAKTGRMDVSGFWFSGGDAEYWGGTALTFVGPPGWQKLRIHHNLFENNKQWSIRGNASTWGLIDSNTFRGAAHGIEVEGSGNADWTTPLVLGTADFFFVEHNTFDWDDWYGSTGAVATDFVNGGRVVFRHNTVRYGFMETHDRARSGKPSANAWEVYDNTFWTDTNKWKAVDISAGTGVIWGNRFTGDWTVPIGGLDTKTASATSIPRCDGTDPNDAVVPGQGMRCQYQIGTHGVGKSAVSYPAYIWDNTKDGALVGMICTEGCEHLVEGRDFINNGATPKPGYAPYRDPHPLANEDAYSRLSRRRFSAVSRPVLARAPRCRRER